MQMLIYTDYRSNMKGTVKEILFELRRNYEAAVRDQYEKVILGLDEQLQEKDAEIAELKKKQISNGE